MVITRLEPVSFAKVSAIVYAIFGLAFGGLFTLIALVRGLAPNPYGLTPMTPFVGVGAVVILPILYGGFGFIGSLLAAWLYNVAAGWVGGIEIQVR
jgi:hypothetical protein